MPNALDIHKQTLSQYLAWLQAGSTPSNADATATSPNNSLNPVPVFTWKDLDYSCNYSWHKGKYLDQGGLVNQDSLVIEVLEPMADPGPQELEMITFQGKLMRIQFIDLAAGKYPKLTCWDPSRGA